jgi:hypothetical protein
VTPHTPPSASVRPVRRLGDEGGGDAVVFGDGFFGVGGGLVLDISDAGGAAEFVPMDAAAFERADSAKQRLETWKQTKLL